MKTTHIEQLSTPPNHFLLAAVNVNIQAILQCLDLGGFVEARLSLLDEARDGGDGSALLENPIANYDRDLS